MRCKACNKIQSSEESRLYDDLCRICHDIATRPDDDQNDQGLDPIYYDEGWKDEQ